MSSPTWALHDTVASLTVLLPISHWKQSYNSFVPKVGTLVIKPGLLPPLLQSQRMVGRIGIEKVLGLSIGNLTYRNTQLGRIQFNK